MMYIIHKAPKNFYWYMVSSTGKLLVCPPRSVNSARSKTGGIPSLRIAEHVPPMLGDRIKSSTQHAQLLAYFLEGC